jgi:hypothetical protein
MSLTYKVHKLEEADAVTYIHVLCDKLIAESRVVQSQELGKGVESIPQPRQSGDMNPDDGFAKEK